MKKGEETSINADTVRRPVRITLLTLNVKRKLSYATAIYSPHSIVAFLTILTRAAFSCCFRGGLEVLLRSSCTTPGHRTDGGANSLSQGVFCWPHHSCAILVPSLPVCQERNAPIHDKKIGMVFCGRQAGALPLIT